MEENNQSGENNKPEENNQSGENNKPEENTQPEENNQPQMDPNSEPVISLIPNEPEESSSNISSLVWKNLYKTWKTN